MALGTAEPHPSSSAPADASLDAEKITILPSKVLEVTYSAEEDAIVLAPSADLSVFPGRAEGHDDSNRVVIRYQDNEPGNITKQAWVTGAQQVSQLDAAPMFTISLGP